MPLVHRDVRGTWMRRGNNKIAAAQGEAGTAALLKRVVIDIKNKNKVNDTINRALLIGYIK